MDTRDAKRRHKRWPEALKREIVAATLEPGHRFRWWRASTTSTRTRSSAGVVAIARRASHLRLHRSTPGLLPVTITRAPEDEPAAPPTLAASDTIEIEVSGTYRVRVGSGFDPRSLKRVLDVLRRR